MRRFGKADLAFVAQNNAEGGTVAKLPGYRVTVYVKVAPAGVVFDAVWELVTGAED